MPTHNSDTQNSDISQNSDTLFALTKMSLYWEEGGFREKNTLIVHWFFRPWVKKNSFFWLFWRLSFLIFGNSLKSDDFFFVDPANSDTRIYSFDAKSFNQPKSGISQSRDVSQNSDFFFDLTKISLLLVGTALVFMPINIPHEPWAMVFNYFASNSSCIHTCRTNL